jgi:hypothetical protein
MCLDIYVYVYMYIHKDTHAYIHICIYRWSIMHISANWFERKVWTP